jgi:hypothetical protein
MNRSATSVSLGFLSSRRAPHRVLIALLALLIVVSGCSKSGPKDVVSGKVTLNGQDVKGIIVFSGSDGKEASFPLSGGKYSIANPPLGDVVVMVRGMMGPPGTEKPQKAEKPKIKGPAGTTTLENTDTNTGVDPPGKYYKKETSTLKYTLKGGRETIDIELQP